MVWYALSFKVSHPVNQMVSHYILEACYTSIKCGEGKGTQGNSLAVEDEGGSQTRMMGNLGKAKKEQRVAETGEGIWRGS